MVTEDERVTEAFDQQSDGYVNAVTAHQRSERAFKRMSSTIMVVVQRGYLG